MSVEYIETRLLEETMVGTGSKKILRADEDGLEDGKLLKSTSTGISSANLSDHLEGTPGQITVSPHGTGGAKVGFESVPVTNKKLMLVNGAVVETSLPGVNNILRLDSVIQQGASRPSTFYNCGNYSSAGANMTSVPGEFIVDLTSLVDASDIIMDVSLLTYTLNAGISTQAKFTLYMSVSSNTTYSFFNPNIVGKTANRELDIAFSYQGNNRYLVIGTPTETYGLGGYRGIILNIDKIISSNSLMSLTKASLSITFNGTGTSVIGPGGHTLKQRFKLYPSLTSGLVQANGLPNLEASTSSRTLAWNTSIGSSSAPATLNVYGKSTLSDRLTVPKDGSNSTSGIIDVGDSYYLGGSRLIHNQGGNYCTAVGYNALRDNTEGSYNSAMGGGALRYNTTGSYNSAMGYAALHGNVTGVTGSSNSAMGYIALLNNTEGSYNSAMGHGALRDNTEGSNNSAMGYAALRANTEGSNNSAIGYTALSNNTEGSNNSAMGRDALSGNKTGSYNSAMGNNAGRYIANGSTSKTTGDNNLYLGSETKAKENGTNNEIVIGASAIGLGSNSMVLGHTTNLLTALRGKVGIGTDAPEHGLHVGKSYDSYNNIISDGNIKANNKLIAGTHVEAGGNITSDDTVQGNYVKAVKKNGAGGNVNAANDIIASRVVSAGHALNTTITDPLNQGEVLIYDKDNYLNNLGSDVMLSGISTHDKYIVDTRKYIEFSINLPMFQVETLLAYKIITIDNQIIREEGISIVSTISTLLDGNGRRMQRHKVLSHHCIGYRPSVSYVDIWDNALAMGDANNPGVNDAILQGDFFSFDEALLANNKLSPVVEFTDLSAFVDNYNLGTTFKIDYSYRFNVNAFGSNEVVGYATK